MLTKNLTKERIENKFSKYGLNCENYINYIFEKDLLNSTKGKSHHHIFLKSIFGDNDKVIQLTKKEHT